MIFFERTISTYKNHLLRFSSFFSPKHDEYVFLTNYLEGDGEFIIVNTLLITMALTSCPLAKELARWPEFN